MWLVSLIHKGRTLDPTTMPSQTVLEMVICAHSADILNALKATINGAKTVLWNTELGSLESGKKADLVVIDPNTPNMLPLHDPISRLKMSLD